jgi:hypothetical protein
MLLFLPHPGEPPSTPNSCRVRGNNLKVRDLTKPTGWELPIMQ